jgi:hypothetical protein
MKNEKDLVWKVPDDAFAQPREIFDLLSFKRVQVGLDRAHEEWAFDDDFQQLPAGNAAPQGFQVAENVGELGHGAARFLSAR